MIIPSRHDRLAFWKHSYARSSFIQTRQFTLDLLSSKAPEYSPARDVFTIAILGAYCRPFKQRKPVRLDLEVVPSIYRDLHDSLEQMRDKVIAHRDLDGPVTDWGFISALHITTDNQGMEINTISPKFTDQKATELLPLLRDLIAAMDAEINAFVKEHIPPLPLLPARYVISLDENPTEWIIKQ